MPGGLWSKSNTAPFRIAPIIRPATIPAVIDHDRLFKELLTTFFTDFLDLFLPELSAYLDRSSVVFLDKEVFTDVTAGTRHEADLVAKASFRGQASFFLMHLEHQAQTQAEF